MDITRERLLETYAAMSSEQLLILRARSTLTDLADQVIDEVLNERQVTAASRDSVQENIKQQQSEEARKAGLVASFIIRILGQFVDMAVASSCCWSDSGSLMWFPAGQSPERH